MTEIAYLLSMLLSTAGATILIVEPEKGPGAWIREKVLRPGLMHQLKPVLDCNICTSFWIGIVFGAIWFWQIGEFWCLFNPFMTPFLFWCLEDIRRGDPTAENPGREQEDSQTEGSPPKAHPWYRTRANSHGCRTCGKKMMMLGERFTSAAAADM